MSKTWYEINAGPTSTEVLIYDEIGAWGVTAKQFIKDLNNIQTKNISLRINSPGGSVWDGDAIFNALRRSKANITTHIDGLAASMASIIALAGSTVEMADNAFYMIHNPWSLTIGDADQMRKDADLLDKIAGTMTSIYAKKTGMTEEEITTMMNDETWLTAEEAMAFGFVDSVFEGLDAAASVAKSFDFEKYGFHNIPEFPHTADKPAAKAVPNHEESAMTGKTTPGTAPTTEGVVPQVTTEDVNKARSDAEAKAAADAQVRLDGIYSVFSQFGDTHRALMDECVKDTKVSVEMAREKLLNALGKDTTAAASGDIKVGETDKEKFAKGAGLAIMGRSGLIEPDKIDRNNEFMNHSLFELAKHCLALNGRTPSGNKMDIVATAFTTTDDFTNILRDAANKSMLKGWEETDETYPIWTSRGSLSDFKIANRTGLSLFSDLPEVPEHGEFTMGTFSDANEQIQLLTYGSLFAITRQAIINDDLNAFSAIPRRMGRAARRKVGDLAYTVPNANAAMADGTVLFHADHSNLGTSGVISATTISELKKLLALQTDPSGNGVLNIRGRYILVPVAIEDAARAFFASEYNPAEGSSTSFRQANIHRNTLEVVSDARLDGNSATAYYILGDQNIYDTVEVAFLDGMDMPFLDQKAGWDVDGVEFKVRIDAAAKALDHRAMTKNVGT